MVSNGELKDFSKRLEALEDFIADIRNGWIKLNNATSEEKKPLDVLEIGTPSKTGKITVYGDANKPEEFKKKILNMLFLRAFAQEKLERDVEASETLKKIF